MLKINGKISAYLTDTPYKVQTEEEFLFSEFFPYSDYEYKCAVIDEEFLTNPKNGFSVCDLKGAYLITYLGIATFNNYGVLKQHKSSSAVITAFIDDKLKLSIETPNDFYTERINYVAEKVEIYNLSAYNTQLFAIIFSGEENKLLKVYNTANEIKEIFTLSVNEIDITDKITATERLYDIAKHTVVSTYSIENEKIRLSDRKITEKNCFSFSTLSDCLLPYAFTEEILVGGDCSFLLSDKLKENAEKLKGFFGDYIGVITPPRFRDYKEIGLIYKTAPQLYSTEYFVLEAENGKIYNIYKV